MNIGKYRDDITGVPHTQTVSKFIELTPEMSSMTIKKLMAKVATEQDITVGEIYFEGIVISINSLPSHLNPDQVKSLRQQGCDI